MLMTSKVVLIRMIRSVDVPGGRTGTVTLG